MRALRAGELREVSASLFFLALFLFLSVHSTVEPSLSTITEALDEVLLKVIHSKQKKLKVIYKEA